MTERDWAHGPSFGMVCGEVRDRSSACQQSIPRGWIVCHLITVSKAVAERSVGLRRWSVRAAGGIGSANAGMSSDKECEKHSRRKSKGSSARLIRRG